MSATEPTEHAELSDLASLDERVASPEQIASDLAAMMRTGVTVKACRAAEALCGLTITRAKAPSVSGDDLASAASHLVKEACARVDDIGSGNTAVLLGLAAGFRGVPPKTRRQHVADVLFVTTDHVRKYLEPRMLEAVADELYARDSAYRLRHRHRTEIEENPTKTRLQVDWLQQHRSYRRIWTPVTALRADTLTLVGFLRDLDEAGLEPRTSENLERLGADDPTLATGDDWHAVSDRCMNLCWRLAQFTRELDRFVEREGGLWLLADAESELCAADAMYRLSLFLPFGEVDTSVLTILLDSVPAGEADPFDEALTADERWPIFRDLWIGWVRDYVDERLRLGHDAAEHPLARPHDSGPSGIARITTGAERSDCGRWLQAGEDFIELIDADWYRVADWYRDVGLRPGT